MNRSTPGLPVHHQLLEFTQTHSLWCSAFFTVQLSHPYITTGKTIALTRWTFVNKVMFLLLNALSRFVKVFLPRSKCLLISCFTYHLQWFLEPKKIKSVTTSAFSPSICHEMIGPATIICFFHAEFQARFSLSSFTLIKRFFNFCQFLSLRYHLHIWGCWHFFW